MSAVIAARVKVAAGVVRDLYPVGSDHAANYIAKLRETAEQASIAAAVAGTDQARTAAYSRWAEVTAAEVALKLLEGPGGA